MAPILVFDIETAPDVAGLRRVHAIAPDLPDAAVLDWFTQKRRLQTGGDFLPLQFQPGVSADTLGLQGDEVFTIHGVTALNDGIGAFSQGQPVDPETLKTVVPLLARRPRRA